MHRIIGSVNYKVPFENPFFIAGVSSMVDEPHRINNVMILNACLPEEEASSEQQFKVYNNLAIAFSGTLTNQNELNIKYDFKVDSEILVLLMLFELKGIRMLEELKGTFALALYDTNNRRLFLARDKSDAKPLYLYNRNENFVFSSELNMLVRITKTKVDYKSLVRYLYLGHEYQKSTPYESISEIENGHYVMIDTLTGTYEDIHWGSGKRLSRQRNSLC